MYLCFHIGYLTYSSKQPIWPRYHYFHFYSGETEALKLKQFFFKVTQLLIDKDWILNLHLTGFNPSGASRYFWPWLSALTLASLVSDRLCHLFSGLQHWPWHHSGFFPLHDPWTCSMQCFLPIWSLGIQSLKISFKICKSSYLFIYI